MKGRYEKIVISLRRKRDGVSIEGHCGGSCGIEEGRVCDVCRSFFDESKVIGSEDGMPDDVA